MASSLLQLNLANGATYAQTGGTFLTGIVYAPGVDVRMENAATVYGSVVGKSVYMTGSANVQYDEALREFSLGGGDSGTSGLQVLFRQRW